MRYFHSYKYAFNCSELKNRITNDLVCHNISESHACYRLLVFSLQIFSNKSNINRINRSIMGLFGLVVSLVSDDR